MKKFVNKIIHVINRIRLLFCMKPLCETCGKLASCGWQDIQEIESHDEWANFIGLGMHHTCIKHQNIGNTYRLNKERSFIWHQ